MNVPGIGQQANIIGRPKPAAYPNDIAIPMKHHILVLSDGNMRRKKNKKVSFVNPEHQK
jgi:hypothetical protein